uniref:ATP synthase F0 subunit 8 n=1 Tax=Lamprotula tortuosa TaxID=332607 RepID=A0A0R4YZ36_9BIVA|nr:ATP synthase F0 subunit 8 [Lamprotula tortuosa]
MPQLSPVSWFSVFVFLISMMANMSIINWWYGADNYEVGGTKVKVGGSCSRLFFWGKSYM